MDPAVIFVLLASLVAFAASKPGVQKTSCSIADVMFIMDESSSIWPHPFEQQKQFIKDLTDMFNVGYNQTRVGLVRFSTQARLQFKLNQYTDKPRVFDAIDQIEQIGGNTNTGEALRIARMQGLVAQSGGRPGNPLIPQLVIVITDGNSQEADKTAEQAKLTRDTGVYIFAIGVGSVSHKELTNIASGSEFVFAVENYDALDSIKNKLGTMACESSELKKLEPTLPSENIVAACKEKKMDIALVLDTSSGATETDFEQMQEVLQTVLYSLDISDEATRVALLSYADDSQVLVPLSTHNDRQTLSEEIKKITPSSGKSNTASALKSLRSTFNPKYGARTKVAKVAVFITHARISDVDVAAAEAQALFETYGVEIFAVGLQDKVDVNELKALAGNDHVIAVTDGFTEALRSDLMENICPIRPPPQDFSCGEMNGADIAFALDTANAGANGLLSINSFIRDVTGKFEIGPEKIQISVVANQCHQVNAFNLNKYSTKSEVQDALMMEVGSNTVNVLTKLAKETFTSENGARSPTSGAKRFVVLFVDGAPDSAEEAEKAATEARTNGIEVFVIGIGQKVTEASLVSIASSPNHVFLVKSYDQLEGNSVLAGSLSDAICKSEYAGRFNRPCTFRFHAPSDENHS